MLWWNNEKNPDKLCPDIFLYKDDTCDITPKTIYICEFCGTWNHIIPYSEDIYFAHNK